MGAERAPTRVRPEQTQRQGSRRKRTQDGELLMRSLLVTAADHLPRTKDAAQNSGCYLPPLPRATPLPLQEAFLQFSP